MKKIVVSLFALLLAASFGVAAYGQSGGTYLKRVGTITWLPGTGSNNVCDIEDSLSTTPDVVTLWSASDIRLYVGATSDTMTAATAQAAIDSLCGIVHVSPAAGRTINEDTKWLFSPVRTDTVYVDCYQRYR